MIKGVKKSLSAPKRLRRFFACVMSRSPAFLEPSINLTVEWQRLGGLYRQSIPNLDGTQLHAPEYSHPHAN